MAFVDHRFVLVDRVVELAQAHKGMPNVPHNFVPQFFARVGDLVQRHPVVFDGVHVFLLFVVNVAHVDPQPARLRVLFVFDNHPVRLQRFAVHFRFVLQARQIEPDAVRQIQIDLLRQPFAFPKLAQRPFLFGRVLGQIQRRAHVVLGPGQGALVDQAVHFPFHLFGAFLRAVVGLVHQGRGRASVLVQGVERGVGRLGGPRLKPRALDGRHGSLVPHGPLRGHHAGRALHVAAGDASPPRQRVARVETGFAALVQPMELAQGAGVCVAQRPQFRGAHGAQPRPA